MHDVDTRKGLKRCFALAAIEEKLGFRSSFNFVPERYDVSPAIRHRLSIRGFEIGLHGLKHDGKLYNNEKTFKKRALKINRYLKDWQCVGFRSPAMHHNLDWIHHLNIEYDASTFDTDPFEPQCDGVKTIFPFRVNGRQPKSGYIELPYTMPQDFTLFILMEEKNTRIWKEKLDWIVSNGGMALLTTHPDYMVFDDKKAGTEEYPVEFYAGFLKHIRNKYKNQYWHPLPKDLAAFWHCNQSHSQINCHVGDSAIGKQLLL